MQKLQENVQQFCERYNLNAPLEHRLLDTLSELGEVAKEILKMSNYGTQPSVYKPELANELGDLFYSVITVANACNINLEECLTLAIQKYESRLKTNGIASSGN